MFVDIMTEEIFLAILVPNMDIIYWSDRLSSRKGGGCCKGFG